MHGIKVDGKALEAARKQFCLDTCLDWQEYLKKPNQKCYLQKTVYGSDRFPAPEGARRYSGNDSFFKAIMCMGQLFLMVDEKIYDWAQEKLKDYAPEWFCEYENLHRIDEKLREYGRKIADTHIYFLPEEEQGAMDRSGSAGGIQTAGCGRLPLVWYEDEDLLAFRENNRFQRALGFSDTQPDRLAVAAVKQDAALMGAAATVGKPGQDAMVGMAGVSEDGLYLWQIGIDVVDAYRGGGVAACLVKELKEEVLRRGKTPFYGTSESHTISQTVALKSGFVPAWTEIYVKPL